LAAGTRDGLHTSIIGKAPAAAALPQLRSRDQLELDTLIKYDAETPVEIVKFWPDKRYPPPPFRIDRDFRVALSRAVQEFGAEKIRQHDAEKTPLELVDSIHENIKKNVIEAADRKNKK
jgi:hypothetical protein